MRKIWNWIRCSVARLFKQNPYRDEPHGLIIKEAYELAAKEGFPVTILVEFDKNGRGRISRIRSSADLTIDPLNYPGRPIPGRGLATKDMRKCLSTLEYPSINQAAKQSIWPPIDIDPGATELVHGDVPILSEQEAADVDAADKPLPDNGAKHAPTEEEAGS